MCHPITREFMNEKKNSGDLAEGEEGEIETLEGRSPDSRRQLKERTETVMVAGSDEEKERKQKVDEIMQQLRNSTEEPSEEEEEKKEQTLQHRRRLAKRRNTNERHTIPHPLVFRQLQENSIEYAKRVTDEGDESSEGTLSTFHEPRIPGPLLEKEKEVLDLLPASTKSPINSESVFEKESPTGGAEQDMEVHPKRSSKSTPQPHHVLESHLQHKMKLTQQQLHQEQQPQVPEHHLLKGPLVNKHLMPADLKLTRLKEGVVGGALSSPHRFPTQSRSSSDLLAKLRTESISESESLPSFHDSGSSGMTSSSSMEEEVPREIPPRRVRSRSYIPKSPLSGATSPTLDRLSLPEDTTSRAPRPISPKQKTKIVPPVHSRDVSPSSSDTLISTFISQNPTLDYRQPIHSRSRPAQPMVKRKVPPAIPQQAQPSAHLVKDIKSRDWNSEFQELVSELRSAEDDHAHIELSKKMCALGRDFLTVAKVGTFVVIFFNFYSCTEKLSFRNIASKRKKKQFIVFP